MKDASPNVGDQFNHLTFIRPLDEQDKFTNYLGEFQCICGEVVKLAVCLVRRGFIQSCGCVKPVRPKAEVGLKINRLTLIEVEEPNKSDKSRRYGTWLCECGKTRRIRIDQVKSGNTTSCGCAMKHPAPRNKMSEYFIYHNMIKRCYSPNDMNFKNYGARGITICDRWLEGFENFYEDMGPRPGKGYSIERIDVNGNYEPSNCKWATSTEQNRNRRDTIRLILDGERICLKQLADICKRSEHAIKSRLSKGMTPEQIRDYFKDNLRPELRYKWGELGKFKKFLNETHAESWKTKSGRTPTASYGDYLYREHRSEFMNLLARWSESSPELATPLNLKSTAPSQHANH